MLVNTGWLFRRLLTTLDIDVVCDIGAMDGADSLRFLAARATLRVHAFEANPDNFRRMAANPALRDRRIVLSQLAIANVDGAADLFVVHGDYAPGSDWRGMSSLHRRDHRSDLLTTTRVDTARLDTYAARMGIDRHRAALWIDVEGKSYEVLEGASQLLPNVQLLHAEMESSPCINSQQRCYEDVQALLVAAGFVEVATDRPTRDVQFNALYVRSGLPRSLRRRVVAWLLLARARRLAGLILGWIRS